MTATSSRDDTLSRVSSLETSVAALTADVRTVADAIDKLRGVVLENQRPQWANIISTVALGIVIVGAIGASFISPISIQLMHHDKMISEREKTLADLADRMRDVEVKVSANRESHEKELTAFREGLADIKLNGSSQTRERLAVLEYVSGLLPRASISLDKQK